jgi:endonuclease V-like protein UPF0215 family
MLSATNKGPFEMIPTSIVIALSSVLTTLAMVAVFAAGWHVARRGDLRRSTAKPVLVNVEDQPSVARITLADLRARMRRLEAIAAGIDL